MRVYRFRKDKILTDREKKNINILNMIRRKGPIAKTEISRAISLNIVTVSNYIENYISKELVTEKGLAISTGGRRPLLVELNSSSKYVIGVGLTLVGISAAMIDIGGNKIHMVSMPRPEKTGDNLIEAMVDLVDKLIRESKVSKQRIESIVVGMSGVVDEKSRTITLWGPQEQSDIILNTSFLEDFEKRFSINTFLENDADSAVFGEKWFVLDSSIKNILYLYTGIGCGIIFNSEVYHGATGNAGELGIDNKSSKTIDQWKSASLNLGKWELDLGIVRKVREDVDGYRKSEYLASITNGDLNHVTLNTVISASKNNDAFAVNLMKEAGFELGRKIAYLANLLNPEIVCIGGGFEQGGNVFLDSVRQTVQKYSTDEVSSNLKVVFSHLGEAGVAMGAAAIGVQQVFLRA